MYLPLETETYNSKKASPVRDPSPDNPTTNNRL